MKLKKFTQKFKLFLVFAFTLLMGQNAWAAQLVGYDLSSKYTATVGGGTFTTTATFSTWASSTLRTTGWNTTGHYHATQAFSTMGYYNIIVNATMSSQAGGPTGFILEYNINGAGWLSAGITGDAGATSAITITTSGLNYARTLPVTCSNKTSVQVRWRQTTNATTAAKYNDISLVKIMATDVITPTVQSSNITFVSITPTTITVSLSPGDGDNRIILINTSNTFPSTMANDYNPTASPNYTALEYGSAKVIFNGSGSSVLVTVPTSTHQFWFRVYDYALNGGITRYVNDVTYGLKFNNPNLCALATITANAATNIKLISATLGATISSSPSEILDRGIVWNTTGNVQENDNIQSEGGTSADSYSLNFPDALNGFPNLPRATKIYFKGWVTNLSGTIYSNELNLTNYPVFSGTGNWETAALWNVNEVPGSSGPANYGSDGSVDDSPTINGNCTLNKSNSVTDLTINSGKNLTINTGPVNTGNTLTVTGTLTNNAVGNSGILIKSGENIANGSLIYANGNQIKATVEMYSKAFQQTVTATTHKNKWQYFGIPVTTSTVGSTFGVYPERVRKYDETNITANTTHPEIPNYGLWDPSDVNESTNLESSTMGQGEILTPIDGYEVVQPLAKTYTFAGTLNHGDMSKDLAKTAGADWSGCHILANPFPAALDITQLTFGSNLEQTVYLYNSGSLSDWGGNSGGSKDGTSAGQYTASTGAYAGQLGTPNQIPSMQGFMVFSNGNTNNTFGMPYSAVIGNTKAQRVRASTATKVGTRIDVVGTSFSDHMWLFTEPNCTRNFDNGFDGYKMFGSALTPQLYAMEADGDYQIDAVNDINNTYLGFIAGQDKNLKLTFTHQNLDSKYSTIYLVDLVDNKTVDITASGTEYAFTSQTTPTKRFKIIATPLNTTGIDAPSQNGNIKIFSSQGTIFVQNYTEKTGNIVLYNMTGMAIRNVVLKPNGITTLNNLNSGAYIAKATTESEKAIERLIIR